MPTRTKCTRSRNDERIKALWPSLLQNLCKKLDKPRDPYNHVEQYSQLLFAKKVTYVHMMVQAFGLTMKCRALAWFQVLKTTILYNFKVLIKHFLEAYSKIEIKHNIVTLIPIFK